MAAFQIFHPKADFRESPTLLPFRIGNADPPATANFAVVRLAHFTPFKLTFIQLSRGSKDRRYEAPKRHQNS